MFFQLGRSAQFLLGTTKIGDSCGSTTPQEQAWRLQHKATARLRRSQDFEVLDLVPG